MGEKNVPHCEADTQKSLLCRREEGKGEEEKKKKKKWLAGLIYKGK